jgi:hypothetical protein
MICIGDGAPSPAVASRLDALSAVQNQLYLIDKYRVSNGGQRRDRTADAGLFRAA